MVPRKVTWLDSTMVGQKVVSRVKLTELRSDCRWAATMVAVSDECLVDGMDDYSADMMAGD